MPSRELATAPTRAWCYIGRLARLTSRSTISRWSYHAGAWGTNRVRAFDRGDKGLYVEWYESSPTLESPRKRVRMALGAIDRETAKAKADEIAARFRQAGLRNRPSSR